jgi:tetratricopeptide (TPR) repeat protein
MVSGSSTAVGERDKLPRPQDSPVPAAQAAAAAGVPVYAIVVGHTFLDMTVPHKPPPPGAPPPSAQDEPALEGWLAQLAGLTGGTLMKIAGFNLDPAYARILNETSASYRLTMRPWGEFGAQPRLTVSVDRPGAVVRFPAWISPTGVPARTPRAPEGASGGAFGLRLDQPGNRKDSGADRPAPSDPIVVAYMRGDYALATSQLDQTSDLARWIRDLSGMHAWPDAPERAAVFSLDVAASAFRLNEPRAVDEAFDLLAHQADDLKRAGMPRFECAWYWGALMLIEEASYPDRDAGFIERAGARCADEPRVVLAEAVLADQRSPVIGPLIRTGRAARLEQAQHDAVLKRYGQARAFPATEAEARVREAWLLFRMKRLDEALALTEPLPSASDEDDSPVRTVLDRQVRYVGSFVRGEILRELRRPDEAERAYRQAIDAWPGAQSARLALMTLLGTTGRRNEAQALANAIETAPATASDPWWWFSQGDRQLYPMLIDELRQLTR